MKSYLFALLCLLFSLSASAWSLSPSGAQVEISAQGGSFSVTVSGTENYEWVAGGDSWMTVTRTGLKSFSVTVSANTTGEPRSGGVSVSAYQAGVTHSASTWKGSQAVNVYQAAYQAPVSSVSPRTVEFPQSGGTSSVSVTAANGVSWSVVNTLSWVSVSCSSGTGNANVALTVTANETCAPRSGSLTIAGCEVRVSQEDVPGYSMITYSNLNGSSHVNPLRYKEGDEVVFVDPSPVEGYRFLRWEPSGITAETSGPVEVVAVWDVESFEITNVRVAQAVPWIGKLAVTYDVIGDIETWARRTGHSLQLEIKGTDRDAAVQYIARDVSGDMALTEGTHTFVWNLDDEGVSLVSSDFAVSVSCQTNVADYCVVDLSKRDTAGQYPVSFVSEKPESWDPTSNLYLRRIEPGSFSYFYYDPKLVEITRPFYMAVFEMTESQQGHIVDPETASESTFPVTDNYNYYEGYNPRGNDKGAQWPQNDSVDEDSIIGMLRNRTGLKFDLPTCAQWQLACGAGATTTYFWGNTWSDAYLYVQYRNDGERNPRQVGLKLPNVNGLYDMIGNNWEMCLDWADTFGSEECWGQDPKGPQSGTERALLGGGLRLNSGNSDAWLYRRPLDYGAALGNKGYRLCLNTSSAQCRMSLGSTSEGVALDLKNQMTKPNIEYTEESDDFVVAITWSNSWPVYYSLDGRDPHDVGIRYNGSLKIKRGGGKLIRAVAISPDGVSSEISELRIEAPPRPVILPASGTIISSPVSVNIATEMPNAVIHYTLDGTDPKETSPVYSRFKLSQKATVKAIAVVEGMDWSEIAVAEYALGRCTDPEILPASGTVFDHSNQRVEINWDSAVGVLRYTLDGSDPTAASPIYTGPFTISDTTTVKAKVFDDDYFDSQVVTATLTREWKKVEPPVIAAPDSFSGSRATVAISCATEGAVIRYTIDGSKPNSHSKKYTAPFEVTETTTIRAVATRSDYLSSDIVTLTVSKVWSIGDALNAPDQVFATDSSSGWVRDVTVSKDGVESMRSGPIADSAAFGIYTESTLSTVVRGVGKLSFSWKASTEEDDEYEWDHAEFRVDGETVAKINGESDWTDVAYDIVAPGDHTLTWVYLKDDFGSEGKDCAWIDEFAWVAAPTDPIPEIPVSATVSEIESALSGSADPDLVRHITTAANYLSYRTWASKVLDGKGSPAGRQAVKDSPYAWLSYALDSSVLLSAAPEQGDLVIAAFSKNATTACFDFALSVEGIEVGAKASAENLAEIFELEGSSDVDGPYSSAKLSLTFGTPADGKVRVSVKPEDPTAERFFMKAKMRR